MWEMQEAWVRSLGREDPLEEEMVTYSSTLAWEIPWTERPGGLQSMESQSQAWQWLGAQNTFGLDTPLGGLHRCSHSILQPTQAQVHSYGILEHRGKGRDFTNSLRGKGQFRRSEVRMVLDFWAVTLEVKKQWWKSLMSINTSKYNFKEKKKKKLHSLKISPPIYLLTIVVVSTYVQGLPWWSSG